MFQTTKIMTTSSILSITIYLLLLISINADQAALDARLFQAAAAQDVTLARDAILAGANINARSEGGLQTPLMQSVLFGRDIMVKFFLEEGADVTIGERDGYTPMHGAGFQGRVGIAQMLKDHGVPLREKHDGDGHEPAVRSCWGREDRHTETVKWFLDNGVPIDDIFDECMATTGNEKTKELLNYRKTDKNEL